MKFSLAFLFLPLMALLVGCADAEVGSKQRPFTMYFVPHQDADGIVTTAEGASKFVSKYVSQALYGKDDGFYVKTSVPLDYIAVVEAFGTKKADFATLHTFAYILAKTIKKLDVEPILTVVRGENERSYVGQIIARADSGINTIKDLNGKKFAYTDPSSTSGFLLPRKLFQENNIKLGETVFGKKHDSVVAMVYQGQVDAGATYYSPPLKDKDGKLEYRDARVRVKTQFPDVLDKVKIIGFTNETPNEPWVIRRGLYKDAQKDEKVRKLVTEALIKYSETKEGHDALAGYYDITGVVPAKDSIYDGIREVVLEADIDLEAMFAGKKGKS